MNRFGIISPDARKLRMQWVEDDIAFSSVGDDTWYAKDRGSVFLNPSVSEDPRGDHILGVPVLNLVNHVRGLLLLPQGVRLCPGSVAIVLLQGDENRRRGIGNIEAFGTAADDKCVGAISQRYRHPLLVRFSCVGP
jgi:hypothetical protein